MYLSNSMSKSVAVARVCSVEQHGCECRIAFIQLFYKLRNYY